MNNNLNFNDLARSVTHSLFYFYEHEKSFTVLKKRINLQVAQNVHYDLKSQFEHLSYYNFIQVNNSSKLRTLNIQKNIVCPIKYFRIFQNSFSSVYLRYEFDI